MTFLLRSSSTRLATVPFVAFRIQTCQPCPRRTAFNLAPAKDWKPGWTRKYPKKKSDMFDEYLEILKANAETPIVFLTHNDIRTQAFTKLRQDIWAASDRSMPPSLNSPVPLQPSPRPTLKVMRSSIFGAALRHYSPVDSSGIDAITHDVKGPFAVLSFPQFHPAQLKTVLRALERSIPPRKLPTEAELEQKRLAALADPSTPGRRMKRQRPELVPDLRIIGGLIEGRVLTVPALAEVSNMPTLEQLRAQIVGLLSAPATQLAGVLSEASGQKLARTLDGYRQSLESEGTAEAEVKP